MDNNYSSTNQLCGTKYPEECIYKLPCGTCMLLKEPCKLLHNKSNYHLTSNHKWEYEPTWTQAVPQSCQKCPNHPINGGSGNCNCTLGDYKITC